MEIFQGHIDVTFFEFDLARSIECMKSGQTAEAIAICQNILSSLPEQGKALNQLGCEAFQSGRLTDAVTLLKQAVTLHPRASQLHQNLAIALDALGLNTEAQVVRSSLTQPPFFTLPVRIMGSLGDWGKASGYEVREISQQPFEVPKSAKYLPEHMRQLAIEKAEESHKPAWAVLAENMRLIFWRWKPTGPCSEIMIPVSRNNDIFYDPFWLKYYPFIQGLATDNSHCVIDVTPYTPLRLQVKEECFFLGSYMTYGHWLADHLPRIYALQAAGLPDNMPIVVTYMNDWISDMLEYMQLSNKILYYEKLSRAQCTIIEFDRVWIADGFSMGTRFEFLRSTFAKNISPANAFKPSSRIYISRLSSRGVDSKAFDRVTNADEIHHYVASRGFYIIDTEQINTQQKAEIFGQATIVIAEPGAGSLNYNAFAKQGCVLIYLASEAIFETPSELANKAGNGSFVPFSDRTIWVIGKPVGPYDYTGVHVPAIFPVELIGYAINCAEDILRLGDEYTGPWIVK